MTRGKSKNNQHLQHNNQDSYTMQITYQAPPGMCMVHLNEYQNMVNEHHILNSENIDLRTRILQLSNNEKILQETIITREKTIDELKKENAELKDRLVILEKKISDVCGEYSDLKNMHDDLKNKHDTLDIKFKKMMDKALFYKYIIAIQDLNRIEKLETKMPHTAQINLRKLRNNRIGECHYLSEEQF
jgi:chromosome segregation ATPase